METFASVDPWLLRLAITAIFGVFMFFFAALGLLVEADGQGTEPGTDRMVLLWFSLATGFLLLALLPSAVWIVDAVAQSQDALNIALSHPITIPTALILGLALFGLRERQRFIYGLLEVLGSVIAVTAGAQAVSGLLGKAAGLLSGIYVLIRGLDNMRRATRPARLQWALRVLLSDNGLVSWFTRARR